jgi:hypothetical protein
MYQELLCIRSYYVSGAIMYIKSQLFHLLFCQMSIHVDVEKSTEIFKAKLGISHIYSVDSNPIR